MSRANANLSFALAGMSGANIDAASGVISGVAVITQGPLAAGDVRELNIDSTTLSQISKAAKTYAGGLKVKLDHDGGAGDIIGSLQNFRIDGDVLRADLHLLTNSPHRDYVLEIAEKLSDTFGLSVAFSGQSEKKGDQMFARCKEIYSCDLVTQPAANKNGLFSTQPEILMDTEELKKAIADAVAPFSARLEKLEKKFPGDNTLPPASGMLSKEDMEKHELALVNAAFDKAAESLFKKFGAQIGQPANPGAGPSAPANAPVDPTKIKFEELAKQQIAGGKTRMEATELAMKANPAAYQDYLKRVQSGEIVMF